METPTKRIVEAKTERLPATAQVHGSQGIAVKAGYGNEPRQEGVPADS
jgi:hypothetical protein